MAVVNLGELTAATHAYSTPMITDNIYHRHVALMAFQENKETYPGGTFIQENLEYNDDPESVTGGAIAATGSWDITEIETTDAAYFRPRYYVQTIPLWDYAVADNYSAEVQFWNYATQRQASYMRIMAARFARHLYSKGGGGLQINGLGDIFDNSQPFGNISRTEQAWWRAFVDKSTNPRAFATRALAQVYSDVSDGAMTPDVALTSTDVWVAAEAAAEGRQRYSSNPTLAQLGFDNINFRDKMPIVADKYCDTDSDTRHKMYLLNFDHIRWRPHVAFDMKTYDWMRMPKNLGAYMLVVWFGNITSNQLRRQGLYQDINPTL